MRRLSLGQFGTFRLWTLGLGLPRRSRTKAGLWTLCLPLFVQAAAAAELPPPVSRQVDFAKDIQPIFAEHCYACHGPDKQEAQFRLDTKEIALKGGELGPAITPGKSAESLLIQAVSGIKPDLIMPKKGERLTAEQIGLLRAWI